MQGTHAQRITGPLPIRARLVWLATAALLVAAGLATPSWAKTTRVAETTQNMAIGWNEIASTAIMSTAAQPPHVAVLSMAMVQGAVYDAVNAIDGGHRAYLVKPSASPNDSMDAAAATAAFRVLVGFPERTPPLAGAGAVVAARRTAGAVRHVAREPARRGREDGRDRGRRGGCLSDAHRQAERRPGRAVHVRPRHRARRLAARPSAGTDGDRRGRSGSLGRLRSAVPRSERGHAAVPTARTDLTSKAYTRDFREVKRVGSLTSTCAPPTRRRRRSSGRTTERPSGTGSSVPWR